MTQRSVIATRIVLAACHHRGGAPTLMPMTGAVGWWRVRCNSHLCGATTWAMEGDEKAVSAWNSRPVDRPLAAGSGKEAVE